MRIAKSLLALAAAALAARTASAAEIVVYERADFRGESRRVTSEVSNMRDLHFNDRVSSFRIVSGAWEICTDADFRGRCEVVDRDTPNLAARGWNDAISSMRPVLRREERPGDARYGDRDSDRDRDRDRDRERVGDRDRGRRDPRWVPPPDAAPEIVVFDRPEFSGNRRLFRTDVPNLNDLDFNDRIESLQVNGGVWEACADAGFRGRCEFFEADEPALRGLGFDRSISSLRPVAASAIPARGERGPITIFQDRDFRGAARRIWRDVPDLRVIGFDRAISSVRVAGDGWELCEEPYYRGRCVLLRSDEGNLRDLGFNDRASSLRRVRGR
jgi:hypothetical protein